MQALAQFKNGMIDSIRMDRSFFEILSDKVLRDKTFKSTGLNGVVYLGSILLYKYVICFIFKKQEENITNNGILFALLSGVQLFVALVHQVWILLIYIISLVLSTFWTQDIFDHLMQKRIRESNLEGIQFKPMKFKDILADLIARTVVVVVFLVSVQLVQLCLSPIFSDLVGIATQALLASFYCFEYKTAASGVDTPTGLYLFEQQWIYQLGFGFPFAALQYIFQGIGSSIFFVFFPLLVIVSLDLEGQGVLIKNERTKEKEAPIKIRIFTWCLIAKKVLLNQTDKIKIKSRKKQEE